MQRLNGHSFLIAVGCICIAHLVSKCKLVFAQRIYTHHTILVFHILTGLELSSDTQVVQVVGAPQTVGIFVIAVTVIGVKSEGQLQRIYSVDGCQLIWVGLLCTSFTISVNLNSSTKLKTTERR